MTTRIEPVKYVLAVRELIAKPEAWTQNALARNARGRKVKPKSRSACCWCLSGAFYKESRESVDFFCILDAFPTALRAGGMVRFNDLRTTTHADVLAVLDEAIAKLLS